MRLTQPRLGYSCPGFLVVVHQKRGYSVKYVSTGGGGFRSPSLTHTFIHTNKTGHQVHKDHIVCETDVLGEYSCGSHGGSTS
jgi:hypothetical protein